MFKKSVYFLISLLLIDLIILANLPVLTPVLSFIFFAFIPGILILSVLKIKLNFFKEITLALAISVAFLMLSGFFIDIIGISIGIHEPLSTLNLLLCLNLIFIIFVLLLIKFNDGKIEPKSILIKFTTNIKYSSPFVFIPLFFPILFICGILIMNYTGNNLFLFMGIGLISVYTLIFTLKDKLKEFNYPFSLLMISVSLLLMYSLRSNHILGTDVNIEYALYQSVAQSLYWIIPAGNQSYLACLSISVLPTIFQSLMSVKGELMYKLVFPIIFSFLPLIVYFLSQKFFDNRISFLTGLFFLSQTGFFSLIEVMRQGIALIFVGMAILIIFDETFPEIQKKILFIIFIFSIVISHYSTAYILLIVFGVVWVILISKKLILGLYSKNRKKSVNSLSTKIANNILSYSIIVLFLLFIFVWYAQLTDTAFTGSINFIKSTLYNLNLFFLQDITPNQDTLTPLGIVSTFADKITYYIGTLIRLIMLVGIIALFVNYYKKILKFVNKIPFSSIIKFPDYLKDKIRSTPEEFIWMILISFVLIFADLLVSYIVSGRGSYPINRLYITLMFFIAPLFVFGFLTLTKYIKKNLQVFLLALLILMQLFSVMGLFQQAYGVSENVVFNSEGPTYEKSYIFDQDINSGVWLKNNGEQNLTIYGDAFSIVHLNSIAGIPLERTKVFINKTLSSYNDGYYYFRYTNIKDNIIYFDFYHAENKSDYLHDLNNLNEIYDSGNSQISV